MAMLMLGCIMGLDCMGKAMDEIFKEIEDFELCVRE